MDKSEVIAVEGLTTRKINLVKSNYEAISIPKAKRLDYEEDGWEFVPSKLKKSIRVRKPKKHDIAFENRVWALFAKMGFEYINKDRNFHLNYGSGLTKQVDVFAFDSEAILIIECKSTEIRKRRSYQLDINELASLKNDMRESAKKIATGKQKVAFLFCTNNVIVSKPDRTRLEDNSIIHLNQDAIEYYEQLSEHLGEAAKYQLFGNLFANQTIPGLNNRYPAIKGKVSAGHTIYSFCIDPKYLLKIGYILHRTDTNADATLAYQRIVKKSRLNQIATFINEGGYFPNSIIINIVSKRKKGLQFDPAKQIDHDGTTSYGILHLPKTYRSAFIIDGQHRLYGYAKEKSGSNHTIPVVAFHNLPAEEQAQIFVDINHTQKSVPANLLQAIMSQFHWGSENQKLAISALRTRLLIELGTEDDSPFYNRINLAEEKKTEKRCLTINTLKSWGLNRVEFLGVLRGEELIRKGNLQGKTHEQSLVRSKDFLRTCFDYIEREIPGEWNAGSGEGGFIGMNIGVSALFRLLDDLLTFIVSTKKLDPFAYDGENLANMVIVYLDPVISYIKGLGLEGTKILRGYLGSGATEKVQRVFQLAIHEEIPMFNPEGLADYIRTTSTDYTSEAHDLGHNRIEPMIHDYVKAKLIEEYGEENNNWWIKGVPDEVQIKCAEQKIRKKSTEHEERYLSTIDYKSIISSKENWSFFSEKFTAPGKENSSKEKRIVWLKDFNNIRQKYSHPARGEVSEEDIAFLRDLDKWLTNRLVL